MQPPAGARDREVRFGDGSIRLELDEIGRGLPGGTGRRRWLARSGWRRGGDRLGKVASEKIGERELRVAELPPDFLEIGLDAREPDLCLQEVRLEPFAGGLALANGDEIALQSFHPLLLGGDVVLRLHQLAEPGAHVHLEVLFGHAIGRA